jgi:hypothetical protein
MVGMFKMLHISCVDNSNNWNIELELELEGINSQKEYNARLDLTDMVKKHICSQH